jgi:hypothetical protein
MLGKTIISHTLVTEQQAGISFDNVLHATLYNAGEYVVIVNSVRKLMPGETIVYPHLQGYVYSQPLRLTYELPMPLASYVALPRVHLDVMKVLLDTRPDVVPTVTLPPVITTSKLKYHG